MRGEILPTNLVERLEGLELDHMANENDRLRHVPDLTPGEVRPSRCFRLELGGAQPSQTFEPQQLGIRFRLVVSYVDAPGLGQIIISDCERILVGLYLFHAEASNGGDVCALVFETDFELFQGLQPQQLEAAIVFRVRYKLTGV